jgi:hypothetical protein
MPPLLKAFAGVFCCGEVKKVGSTWSVGYWNCELPTAPLLFRPAEKMSLGFWLFEASAARSRSC